MSRNKIQEVKFQVEEKHRGEWQPLMIKVEGEDEKIQKIVKILPEQAERMNSYKDEEKIKYVLPKAKVVEETDKGTKKPSQKK